MGECETKAVMAIRGAPAIGAYDHPTKEFTMFDKDVSALLTDPYYLAYEAALFAIVAAPLWHLMDKIIDALWSRVSKSLDKSSKHDKVE